MKIRPVAGLCLLATLLLAQDWKTATTLPGVDFTGLTEAKKAQVLKLLRERDCTCGCDMKLAQCRVQDPGCSNSKGLAGVLIGALKEGKKESDALAAAAASKYTPKLLDPYVPIPVNGAPFKGAENPRITLVEFSDFQCPYCAKAVERLDAVLKAYPSQIKLIFKQFPLSNHPQAGISAAASLAAHNQGKFWEMHNALFFNRDKLNRKNILEFAAALKLDMKRFTADLDSQPVKDAIKRDMQDGDKIEVDSTPTVFINGQKYNGSLEFNAIKPIIDAELKKK